MAAFIGYNSNTSYSSSTTSSTPFIGSSGSFISNDYITKNEARDIIKDELQKMLPEIVELLKNSISYKNKTNDKFKTEVEFYSDKDDEIKHLGIDDSETLTNVLNNELVESLNIRFKKGY